MNGPKKYQSYMNTDTHWLGDIPTHWNIQRMKFTALIVAGQSPPSETVSEFAGAFPFLQGNAEFGGKTPTPKLSCQFPNKKAKKQDILLSVRAPVGALNIADQAYGIGRGLCAIRPHQNVNRDFLYYTLLTTKESLDEVATGSTYDAVAIGDVGNVLTPLPPHDEQTTIVRYLDDADQLIRAYVSAKERLIALLEEERQALVHQAVTRGLDPNVKLKDSGVEWLGYVPEHWEIRRAKYLYREADEHSETGTEQLMSVSHKTGVTPRKENVTMFLAESNIGHKLCRPGDIVINTMWAFMAALGVARQEGLVSPSYGVYRPHGESHLDHDYMDSLIRTEAYRMDYLVRSTGITSSRLRLYPESFLGIPLVYPPKVEQDAIAEHIGEVTTSVDDAITRTRSQIDLMNEYRTRLIADVVTGKIDVREAAERLPELKYEDRTAEQQTLSLTQRST